MGEKSTIHVGRREFLVKTVPACALTCLAMSHGLAFSQDKTQATSDAEKHKFDRQLDRKFTAKQLCARQFRGTVELARAFEGELGKEKVIDILKNMTREKSLAIGKRQVEANGDASLHAYTRQFADPTRYQDSLTMKIVEDTEKAFELEVTECLWATVFLEAKAGDIGSACVCHGDYAWAEGYNPKIKLVRDKTLMEGKALCNHRYIYQG